MSVFVPKRLGLQEPLTFLYSVGGLPKVTQWQFLSAFEESEGKARSIYKGKIAQIDKTQTGCQISKGGPGVSKNVWKTTVFYEN